LLKEITRATFTTQAITTATLFNQLIVQPTTQAQTTIAQTDTPTVVLSKDFAWLLAFLQYMERYDATACLLNCSSRGVCSNLTLNNKQLYCNCFENYKGLACEYDERPCAHAPCINNATCHDLSYLLRKSSVADFECNCQADYYGRYCQNKISLCENETCSYNGQCIESLDEKYCKCFLYYSGVKCELVSQKLLFIQKFTSTSLIVAIVIIVSFVLLIVFCDAWDFLIGRKAKRARKENRAITRKSYLDFKRLRYVN
jgi:hypothetical protein